MRGHLKGTFGKYVSVGLKLTVEKCTLGQKRPVRGRVRCVGRAGVGGTVGRVHSRGSLRRRGCGGNMIVAMTVTMTVIMTMTVTVTVTVAVAVTVAVTVNVVDVVDIVVL